MQAGGIACGGRAGVVREAGRAFDLLPLLLARRGSRLWEQFRGRRRLQNRWLWRGWAARAAHTIRLAYLPQVAVVPPLPDLVLVGATQGVMVPSCLAWGNSLFPGTQLQVMSTLMQRLLGEQSLRSDSGFWF